MLLKRLGIILWVWLLILCFVVPSAAAWKTGGSRLGPRTSLGGGDSYAGFFRWVADDESTAAVHPTDTSGTFVRGDTDAWYFDPDTGVLTKVSGVDDPRFECVSWDAVNSRAIQTGSGCKDILVVEGPVTNLHKASRDFDNTTYWTQSAMEADDLVKDAVGIDGVENSAHTVQDDDAAGYENFSTANGDRVTVLDDSYASIFCIFVKQGSSPSYFPRLDAVLSGGTSRSQYISFDHSDGTIDECIDHDNNDQVWVEEYNINSVTWYRFCSTITNNATGNTELDLTYWPAALDAVCGTSSAGAIASQVVDQVDVWSNTTGRASSRRLHAFRPIVTTTATVTKDEDSGGLYFDGVDNGYWDETLGAEYLTDNDFTGDGSAWIVGSPWTIDTTNDEADIDGSQSSGTWLCQDGGDLTVGSVYKLTYTIQNYVAGYIYAEIHPGTGEMTSQEDKGYGDGTYVKYLRQTDSGNGRACVVADSDFNGSVDDIYVKEVTNSAADGECGPPCGTILMRANFAHDNEQSDYITHLYALTNESASPSNPGIIYKWYTVPKSWLSDSTTHRSGQLDNVHNRMEFIAVKWGYLTNGKSMISVGSMYDNDTWDAASWGDQEEMTTSPGEFGDGTVTTPAINIGGAHNATNTISFGINMVEIYDSILTDAEIAAR